ncbi:hypothetical protein XENORESO_014432 [Xenotaenia resolanae]|uniref:Uncharacterized protein n=1 Tax=Xenotaenia resolanae TaxID=208358 RepID=A0ABV0W9Z3_9TELE
MSCGNIILENNKINIHAVLFSLEMRSYISAEPPCYLGYFSPFVTMETIHILAAVLGGAVCGWGLSFAPPAALVSFFSCWQKLVSQPSFIKRFVFKSKCLLYAIMKLSFKKKG